ncbi:MAG TPA: hypothetical protein VM658_15175, partial [bacterium]|nr:hypothetical protein [bacterium]
RQERQGLFLNTILRGLGCECFLLGAPVGRFAKPVGADVPDLFFAGPQRNIMIYLAILGALGVLAVFLRPILDKSDIFSSVHSTVDHPRAGFKNLHG